MKRVRHGFARFATQDVSSISTSPDSGSPSSPMRGADALHHLVRLLVRDPKLALHLLGRDPATSASHEVHRVEPQVQRRRGPLKDGALLRVDVQPTGIAGVGRRESWCGGTSAPARSEDSERGGRPRRIGHARACLGRQRRSGNALHELHERVVRFGGFAALRVVAVALGAIIRPYRLEPECRQSSVRTNARGAARTARPCAQRAARFRPDQRPHEGGDQHDDSDRSKRDCDGDGWFDDHTLHYTYLVDICVLNVTYIP